ncbi:hypothetical protein CYY_008292 [Polysphondylium violaceum]|uniref:NHL repeat-containing protein n=1 Tax=Polysphondylium violaceum TaxID=133409 RepID=A0A8J4UXE9_9MYCE|nr:hypothetical protein CYY_008292 [Polysphondylium violaceum]
MKISILVVVSVFIVCLNAISINQQHHDISFKHHHHTSSESGSDSYDPNKSFTPGNILITDSMNAFHPDYLYEFDIKGHSVSNYTTWLESNDTVRCLPNDIAFLDGSTLLLLDSQQGVFYSTHKGNIKEIYNGMNSHSKTLGCDLQRINVDQVNQKIYITSANVNCDLNHTPGVFVYNTNGDYQYTILNSNFNMTLGISGDSNGDIWIPDVNEIFVYSPKSKSFKTYDPVPTKIAYNGITITANDHIYVSVPDTQQDMVIQIDTNGDLVRAIKLNGDTQQGRYSGLPGSLIVTDDYLMVEVPYASKKEIPGDSSASSSSSAEEQADDEDLYSSGSSSGKLKVDIVEIYNLNDGSFYSSFGGHSCKEKNILCIPYYGFALVPNKNIESY